VSGAIYPFLDDLNETLHPHFSGTRYECLFVGNFVDRVYTFDLSQWKSSGWNPAGLSEAKEINRIYCALGYYMGLVTELLESSQTTTNIAYYLTLYTDQHIPLIIHMTDVKKFTNEYLLSDCGYGAPITKHGPSQDHIFHEGLIPNVINYISECSFWSDVRSKVNPIVHILSKGLPQRCQIRNMREIMNKYSRKHEAVYNFIHAALFCSLLGNYRTCTHRPGLNVRVEIYRKMRSIDKIEFLSWMLADHQQLLFYVIKEFLVFGVRDIPSIYEEIKQRYYWDKFEESVSKAMNTVRRCIKADPFRIMCFEGIEQQLVSINKQQVHHLFRPTKHLFCNAVIQESEKIDDSNFVDYYRKEFPIENRELMNQLAIRVPLESTTPFEWLKYFGVGRENITRLSQIQDTYILDGTKGSLKNFLSGLSRYEFEAVRDLCESFDRKYNVRMFTLPVHYYVQQCQALRIKYNIKSGEELPDHTGETYVCMECKQFKGFITRREKDKSVNLYAYGHSKVIIDDETMELYCGKRSEKVDGKKRNLTIPEGSSFMDLDVEEVIRANDTRNQKRAAKEKRKDLKNCNCVKTPLVKLNLLGKLLQFYGKLYMICPVGGNFMEVNSEHFTKNGMYCGCCLQHGKLYTSVKCEWCKASKGNETWSPVKVKTEGQETNIYLCQGCLKPWIRNAETILEMDTIKRGLEQKWKRLQHPGL
jgi:hypothetical protein